MTKSPTQPHLCERKLPSGAYGEAITRCEEDPDGTLWVTNDEYASQVNYCPFCGFRATKPVPAP